MRNALIFNKIVINNSNTQSEKFQQQKKIHENLTKSPLFVYSFKNDN